MTKAANRNQNWLLRITQFVVGAGILSALIGLAPWFFNFFWNSPPVANLVASPAEGTVPLEVLADAPASDPDGDALSFTWMLDDAVLQEGQESNYTFRLTEPGQVKLGVIVSDDRGGTSKRVQLVRVIRPEIQIDSLSLSAPLVIMQPDHIVRLPEILVTNGYPVTINAHTVISDASVIVAFETSAASSGQSGSDQGRAPNGQNGGQNPGASGARGGEGEDGSSGFSAGSIQIRAETIDGPLTIDNSGQTGGDGGRGGAGGRGGDGGHGRSARDGVGAFGVGNCESGPGRGGAGGAGGPGGNGGDAGRGGNGGSVTVVAVQADAVEVRAPGGMAGAPGLPGAQGEGGRGGSEGRTTRYCSSANRYGASGGIGAAGSRGAEAEAGTPGQITLTIGDFASTSEGLLIYP